MVRKIAVAVGLAVISFTSVTWAFTADDYTSLGRDKLFQGTLSDLRSAYEVFDAGVNDPCCVDCNSSDELRFFHAVAGAAMLLVDDDSNSVDSIFELSELFDVNVVGNFWAPYFKPLGVDLVAVTNEYDAYEIPADAPDINEVRDIIDTSFIPQIDAALADLDSISDSPGARFKVFLDPGEVRVFFHQASSIYDPCSVHFDPNSRFLQPLEVDYGEVLLFKGLLLALKAQLMSQSAYDLYVDPNDPLAEKAYGEVFSIKRDLLATYPGFLRVLPTPNYPTVNGKALLAQAANDINDAILFYLQGIDYIANEDNPLEPDPQENELLYLDPNSSKVSDAVNEILTNVRASLVNDTSAAITIETKKKYVLEDANATSSWELGLEFGFELDGYLMQLSGSGAPSTWEIDYSEIRGNRLFVELDYEEIGLGGGGLLTATISEDYNSITDGQFSYWICCPYDSGLVENLSGELFDITVADVNIDLNPVFGSSARYPNPVSPRGLLPEFDKWNGPQPGTMGHGLGNDATLGGIAPDMTHDVWQWMFDYQPGGLVLLDAVGPGEIVVNGDANEWSPGQLVLDDSASEEDIWMVQGVNIDKVYLARQGPHLVGAVTFYDDLDANGHYYYELKFSYSPDNQSARRSIRLAIVVEGGLASGSLYYKNPDWRYIKSFDVEAGANCVEFAVTSVAPHLRGRFISIDAEGADGDWYEWDDDENDTHLKIGGMGTVSGTVSYAGYIGAPIFVEAYTELHDPEDSVVARTMIMAPGAYSLDGIGIGWRGYVRAYTPLFGFNIFDMDALTIEAMAPAVLSGPSVGGVDIVLSDPNELEKDVCITGSIDSASDEDWYSLYAVAGETYTLHMNRSSQSFAMTLYSRDGHTELRELYYWQPQHTDWHCVESGTYYVKVSNGAYPPSLGPYEICMTKDAGETPVFFADANLKAAVEAALGVTDPTATDMLGLTGLTASSSNITDLTGLEYATNLTHLYLFSNQISSISALSGLTNLTSLYLYDNQISDISALSGLTNLTDLWLYSNQISNISALSGLTNLTSLYLHNNQISDISAFSGLTNLTDLWLYSNQINDISALSGLTNLMQLYLGHNQISDISVLSGLTNLTHLQLRANQISDISALSGLTNLGYLYLENNYQISNISTLSGLTNLTVLWLDSNQISDISPLTAMTSLTQLYLTNNQLDCVAYSDYLPTIEANNPGIDITYDPEPASCSSSPLVFFADANLKAAVEAALGVTDPTEADMLGLTSLIANGSNITDLTGLEYATNLIRLKLYSNQISDISALSGLINLTYLNINENQISDISALSGLTALTYLNLSYNPIGDISALSGLTNLTTLYLMQSQVSNISALSGLTNLDFLYLRENQVSDISALSGLTSLTYLYLGDNQISDISALSGLTSMENLWLFSNQISDISALSGMTNLTSLQMAYNQVSDISALAGLTSLTGLWLYSNQISDISALSGLTNLTTLWLGNNQISNISALSGLTGLTSLYLSSNQIIDISALTGLTNLTMLYLTNNQLDCLAYSDHLPTIIANNPEIDITYDPEPGSCSSSPPVFFADANLKAAVEAALGLTDPTEIDMLGLIGLSAFSSGITDLTGLEYALNLTDLNLHSNQINDISELSGLTDLTYLVLYSNQISDISALSGLTNLSYLLLDFNQIGDVSALSGLTNLTVLWLSFNQISDISALSGLTNLTELYLGDNQINDISAVCGLTNLTKLLLLKNNITDVSCLEGLTNLTHLWLWDNQIRDISCLAGLINLTDLYLYNNQISDISALSGLTDLATLWLSDNQISDISPLSGMTSLVLLYMTSNPLDCVAYSDYLSTIEANNPGIEMYYDPEPASCSGS